MDNAWPANPRQMIGQQPGELQKGFSGGPWQCEEVCRRSDQAGANYVSAEIKPPGGTFAPGCYCVSQDATKEEGGLGLSWCREPQDAVVSFAASPPVGGCAQRGGYQLCDKRTVDNEYIHLLDRKKVNLADPPKNALVSTKEGCAAFCDAQGSGVSQYQSPGFVWDAQLSHCVGCIAPTWTSTAHKDDVVRAQCLQDVSEWSAGSGRQTFLKLDRIPKGSDGKPVVGCDSLCTPKPYAGTCTCDCNFDSAHWSCTKLRDAHSCSDGFSPVCVPAATETALTEGYQGSPINGCWYSITDSDHSYAENMCQCRCQKTQDDGSILAGDACPYDPCRPDKPVKCEISHKGCLHKTYFPENTDLTPPQ